MLYNDSRISKNVIWKVFSFAAKHDASWGLSSRKWVLMGVDIEVLQIVRTFKVDGGLLFRYRIMTTLKKVIRADILKKKNGWRKKGVGKKKSGFSSIFRFFSQKIKNTFTLVLRHKMMRKKY